MDNRSSLKFFDKRNIFFMIVVSLLLILSFSFNTLEKRLGTGLDLSAGQMYTLTEQTQQSLHTLDAEIHIYPVHFPGNQFSVTIEIARKFAKANEHVHLKEFTEHVQMQINSSHTSIPAGKTGLLLCNEDFSQTKFLEESELYSVDASNNAYVKAEGKILSAIENIARGSAAKVRLLTGHSETPWAELSGFLQLLHHKNYETDTYSFLEYSEELNPATDLLLIVAPQKDLTEREQGLLGDFLRNGGRALFFMDNAVYNVGQGYQVYIHTLENFQSIFSDYGMALQQDLLLSTNFEYINVRPTSLWVEPFAPAGKEPLLIGGQKVLLSETSSIATNTMPGVTLTPLFITDPSCYSKALPESAEEAMVLTPALDDEADSYTVAALAQKSNSAILLFADAACLQDGAFAIADNKDAVAACIDFLTPLEPNTVVTKKTLGMPHSSGQTFLKIVLCVIFVGILPLIFLYIGIMKHMKYKLHR